MPTSTRPSLAAQAGQVAASMSTSALRSEAAQAQSTPASTEDRSKWAFFKSPVGIALLVTFAVGAGYAIYSTQDDRVNSPGKQ